MSWKFAFISLAMMISSCVDTNSQSDVLVTDGQVIKNPKDAHGTYQLIAYDEEGQANYGASTVAITQGDFFNTFITNAHVINDIKKFHRVDIIDMNGGVVVSFLVKSDKVTLYFDPGFNNANRSFSDSMDIGAIIFSDGIDKNHLIHGTANLVKETLAVGSSVTIVGGGYGDYRVLQKPSEELNKEFHSDFPDKASFVEGTMHSILRWGKNSISQHFDIAGDYRGGYLIEGVSKVTANVDDKSVSAQGDSGGGVYNSNHELIGLMQGGNSFVPEGEESSQSNAAYSFILDLSQQKIFFEKIRELGSAI